MILGQNVDFCGDSPRNRKEEGADQRLVLFGADNFTEEFVEEIQEELNKTECHFTWDPPLKRSKASHESTIRTLTSALNKNFSPRNNAFTALNLAYRYACILDLENAHKYVEIAKTEIMSHDLGTHHVKTAVEAHLYYAQKNYGEASRLVDKIVHGVLYNG